MTIRPTLDDFPIGCTVKVARLPRRHWRYVQDCEDVVGEIGKVLRHLPREPEGDGPWIVVKLGVNDWGALYRPWWLEKGRVEWIPEASE